MPSDATGTSTQPLRATAASEPATKTRLEVLNIDGSPDYGHKPACGRSAYTRAAVQQKRKSVAARYREAQPRLLPGVFRRRGARLLRKLRGLRGKLKASQLVPYVVFQLLGALAAAWAVLAITGRTFAPEPAVTATPLQALGVEVLYTFALALVVFNTATHAATKGNSFYGLAIGFTIVVGAFAGGPISGGAFNPAVGIGPTVLHALMGSGTWQYLWLYIVGPIVGGALAAGVFALQEA